MLTDQQKSHYDVFGFLHLKQVFTQDEMKIFGRECDRILERFRHGKPFDGKERQNQEPFFEHSPVLTKYLEDDRVYLIGEQLLGQNPVLVGTEANLHIGDTQWHAADPSDMPSLKIAFYLEANTKDTGALRVIPGSHKPVFSKTLSPLMRQCDDQSGMPFGVCGTDFPSFTLETQPGDLVVFPECIWHAAFGGRPGRTQHAVSLLANPSTEERKAATRKLYDSFQVSLRPPESLIQSDSSRLRSLVKPLVDLGFEPAKI